MKERGVGKPWTQFEDNLLIEAVGVHGENDNWKSIALCVPGRTNKACRKRWLHSLSPNVKKTAWTSEEDQLLLSLYAKHGTKWSVIARQISGRTDDACSKRYREALDPSLKREEWTPAEDELLLTAYHRLGGQWGKVGHELNRSGLGCRNRWRMLERRRAHTVQRIDGNAAPAPATHPLPARPEPDHLPTAPVMSQTWDFPGTMTFAEGPDYWPGPPQQYVPPPALIHDDLSGQLLASSGYPMPQYEDLEQGEIREDFSTAPFQFTSSSLSSALSLSAVSPSTAYAGSPSYSSINHYQEVSVNNSHNNTHAPNTPHSHVPSSSCSPLSGAGEQAPPAPVYSPPSPRSSPDLSALGSQDISVPVPFDDTEQQVQCALNCNLVSSDKATEPPRDQAQSYPTPEASPHIDSSSPTLAASPGQTPANSQQEAAQGNPQHYRTPAQKRKAQASIKSNAGVKKSASKNGIPRLSASLPASSDPTVLAYVCGHQVCWPDEQTMSSKCYATSQELYDHWKVQHLDDSSCERPYRCGVTGCGKGWKSINGLQYHLQLSKAHFQQAISASLTRQAEVTITEGADTPSAVPKKKLFACPLPNCPNQYKQMSGLRYHLAHGHSQQLPTQLDYVPPALARKVADKMQDRVSQVSQPNSPVTTSPT